MKKTVFLILFMLTSVHAFTQEPVTFSEVVKVDSTLTANDLYVRAKSWFAETYKSAQDVIQMDDRNSAKIIGKGNFEYFSSIFAGNESTQGWVRYTITIEARDGRYKYTITNFNHEGNSLNRYGATSFGIITESEECTTPLPGGRQNWKNKVWNDIKNTINKKTPSIIQSLKASMNRTATSIENDNW